ncbi:hypothetical protein [Sphingobium sp. CECT 9361]|uniref:hypothetical protein n=1 Tax=Sphingobium sp. CECT 9361 TaxID=2845384 RepID=UPI001E4D40E9|nr:hypothetical protein [Sphingobium sp. CECT 9361]CAH0355958.1 hypothetical protein SPH9361_03812 [Sphingobium sp. CECT 9361]
MAENPWAAWEMAAVDGKFMTYLVQLLLSKEVISHSEIQNLCKQLVENMERTGSENAALYARALIKGIPGVEL